MLFGEDELESLRKAGKIASEVRRWSEKFVKEGMKIIEICEAVENEIIKRGGRPAFPCNVDVNEISAHYTSPPNDQRVIPPNSIVKVDIGVHVNGYIADTATSICFNFEYSPLKQAADEALEAAMKIVKSGVKVSTIGEAIQNVIEKKYDLKPIRNLTGHGLGRFTVHSETHIPNVSTMDLYRLKDYNVYAVEPFATTRSGAGEVAESGSGYIYRIVKDKLPKGGDAELLLNSLKNNFYSLPFALRWATKVSPVKDFKNAFNTLLHKRCILGYPLFVEKNLEPVSQAEHTFIVLKDHVEITTL